MSDMESYSESEAEEAPAEATEEQPAEDETTSEEPPADSPEEEGPKSWSDQGAPRPLGDSEAPAADESGEDA
jgi:hypothetical protein